MMLWDFFLIFAEITNTILNRYNYEGASITGNA